MHLQHCSWAGFYKKQCGMFVGALQAYSKYCVVHKNQHRALIERCEL